MNYAKLGLLSLALILFASTCGPAPAKEATTAVGLTVTTATATREPTHTPRPTPTSEPEYPTYADVPYVDDGHPEHVLDVYLPGGEEELLPTLFVVHGLFFSVATHSLQLRSFSKQGYDGLARHFAQQGYAVVLIDYRWPSQAFQEQMTRDAFCALAWVHANAETYGFDRQRIALLGVNWGAAIAAKLAAVDDRDPYLQGCPHLLPASGWAKGVVTFAGCFDTPEHLASGWHVMVFAQSHQLASEMLLNEVESIFETLRGIPYHEWRDNDELDDRARQIAPMLPLYWVDGSEPPFLLIDGASDLFLRALSGQQVPAESEGFAAELQAAGVDAELLQLVDARWRDLETEEPSEEVLRAIEAFLDDLFE